MLDRNNPKHAQSSPQATMAKYGKNRFHAGFFAQVDK
jgi:hypothetical protein